MKTLILIVIVGIAVNSYGQTSKQLRGSLMDSAHNMYDGTLTEFDENNSDEIEDRDARKANNFQWNFGLLRDGINLSIERRKTVDTVFFNMWNMTTMKYSLDINPTGLPQGRLYDRYLNTIIIFGSRFYYPFIVDADFPSSYRSDRFIIIFDLLAASKAIETKVTVFPNPSSKWINYRIDGKVGAYRIYFYNDAGLLVYTRKATVADDSGFTQRIYLTGGSKFYTLKVVSPDSKVTTTKVVVQ